MAWDCGTNLHGVRRLKVCKQLDGIPISGHGHTVKSHVHNFLVDAYTEISSF